MRGHWAKEGSQGSVYSVGTLGEGRFPGECLQCEDTGRRRVPRGASTVWGPWVKEGSRCWGVWSWTARNFILLLRTVLDLKLMIVYFWSFSFNVFRPRLMAGS